MTVLLPLHDSRRALSAVGGQFFGGGQPYRECRAVSHRAGDIEPAAVAIEDVFDDGEAKAGAAQLARAAGVDPIKAPGEGRHMLVRDAVPLVGYCDPNRRAS